MLCLRCGHDSPPHSHYCARCSAILPRMELNDGRGHTLDVEDGREYVVPQRSFPTRYLYDLTCRAHDYIHLEAPGEPLLEARDVVRNALENFRATELPGILDRMREERIKAPHDDYWTQMPYLIQQGLQLMDQGFRTMEDFVQSGEVGTLKAAIAQLQEGNDHLGQARELAQTRALEGRSQPPDPSGYSRFR